MSLRLLRDPGSGAVWVWKPVEWAGLEVRVPGMGWVKKPPRRRATPHTPSGPIGQPHSDNGQTEDPIPLPGSQWLPRMGHSVLPLGRAAPELAEGFVRIMMNWLRVSQII